MNDSNSKAGKRKDTHGMMQGKLAVINTWFEGHPRRYWTWKNPGDRTRNQTDYILIQERFHISVTSCKPMPGADCGCDHVPFVGIKLKKLSKAKRTQTLQMNMQKLTKKSKKNTRLNLETNSMAQINSVQQRKNGRC